MKVAAALDLRHIGHGGIVAGDHQVIAVVDPAAELGIDVGAAAAAGILRRLVQPHMRALLGEADRRGQPGEAGADHMDPAPLHGAGSAHRKPYRKASQSFCHLGSEMRANGSRQSARIRRSRIAR